jgi:hypothetical protein
MIERDAAVHAFDTLRDRLGAETPRVTFGPLTLSHHEGHRAHERTGRPVFWHNARLTGRSDDPAVWRGLYEAVRSEADAREIRVPTLAYWGAA